MPRQPLPLLAFGSPLVHPHLLLVSSILTHLNPAISYLPRGSNFLPACPLHHRRGLRSHPPPLQPPLDPLPNQDFGDPPSKPTPLTCHPSWTLDTRHGLPPPAKPLPIPEPNTATQQNLCVAATSHEPYLLSSFRPCKPRAPMHSPYIQE